MLKTTKNIKAHIKDLFINFNQKQQFFNVVHHFNLTKNTTETNITCTNL
jgi:hypothetical protein